MKRVWLLAKGKRSLNTEITQMSMIRNFVENLKCEVLVYNSIISINMLTLQKWTKDTFTRLWVQIVRKYVEIMYFGYFGNFLRGNMKANTLFEYYTVSKPNLDFFE